MNTKPLLRIENLNIEYVVQDGVIKAVRNVSFDMNEGEIVCLVGESGSGKSTIGLAITGALPENAIIRGGRIIFQGQDLMDHKMGRYLGKEIMMIFQDPAAALNPLFTIEEMMADVIKTHLKVRDLRKIKDVALKMLRTVGLPDQERILRSYPHELSGGMLQRAMIAIALSVNPKLLIADEPTTMLDVTLQAQILELLLNLKTEFGLSILLITHNLGIAAEMGGRIIVIYGGEIVEEASSNELIQNPLHPYTKGLIECIPRTSIRYSKLKHIPGMMPDLRKPPSGCIFYGRCSEAVEECRTIKPLIIQVHGDHKVACHLYFKVER